MGDAVDNFITHWRDTGGSELANTQSFVNGLCVLIGVAPPMGSRTDDVHNDYVFERRVFQDNGDGSASFGRIDAYTCQCDQQLARLGLHIGRVDHGQPAPLQSLLDQAARGKVRTWSLLS